MRAFDLAFTSESGEVGETGELGKAPDNAHAMGVVHILAM
jgi:hypothetical protein